MTSQPTAERRKGEARLVKAEAEAAHENGTKTPLCRRSR